MSPTPGTPGHLESADERWTFASQPTPNTRLRVLPFLRRRLWIIVLFAVIAAGVALVVASGSTTTYSATGYLVVPANGNGAQGQPDTASGAEGLAETYAVLLPNDPAFTEALFNVSAKTPAAASAIGHLSLVSLGRTSVIRVSTSSPTSRATLGVFAQLATVLSRTPPVSSNIIPGTLRVLQQPTAASRAKNYHREAPLLGGLLGAVLGAFLGLVLERARPRIDDPQDVVALTGLPLFDLRSGGGSAASLAMHTRLSQSDKASIASDVVVIGVGRRAIASATWTAKALQASLVSLQASLPHGRSMRDVRFAAVGDPKRELDGLWLAQDADESWLSIPSGIRASEVNDAVSLLDRCGVRPTYAAVSPRHRWGRRMDSSLPAHAGGPTRQTNPPLSDAPSANSKIIPSDRPGRRSEPRSSPQRRRD